MSQETWEQRMTQVVAAEVRRYRKERGMSTQQLADRCEEQGFPIARSVLANLENGRRESITLAEICTLASALDAPPILLLFPVGREEYSEMRPLCKILTWDAMEWFAGLDELPVRLNLEHQQWIHEWYAIPRRLGIDETAERPEGLAEHPATQDLLHSRATVEVVLATLRNRMRDHGLTPPPLPPPLERGFGDLEADDGPR